LDVLKVDRKLHLSSPTFCCIVSPGAARTSIRCHGRVLPNRRRRAPFLSCLSDNTTPTWSAKRSVARGRPDAVVRPDIRRWHFRFVNVLFLDPIDSHVT
jgi:hypothetical protein